MRDALMGRLAWKKGHDRGTSPYHFPMWVPPGVFTSIYLKLITSYYAHIFLIAMLYFDRIIQGLKLTK